MEAAGLAFSVAQTLFASLQCNELRGLFSNRDYESQVQTLQSSITDIQALLKDADAVQALGIQLTAAQRNFIQKIKEALYDADDLLDEYATVARRQQLHMEGGNKASWKVLSLISRLKNLSIAYSRSPKVKETTEKLVKIAENAAKYRLEFPPIKRTREETHSHVIENHIVGRENDRKTIVDMLLDPKDQWDGPLLAIVGMGGLGKTALAQLVYNDERIRTKFGDRRFWVCLVDLDENESQAKAILVKILESIKRQEHIESTKCQEHIGDLTLSQVIGELKGKLGEDKFLLVLDDVWNEDPLKLGKWVDVLTDLAQRESRIVVTTRSQKTATALGSSHPYRLEVLSNEDSWRLFEMHVGKEKANHPDLVKICEDIVKQCANVPLVINVVGSLLCVQPENNWQLFQQSIYTLIGDKKDDGQDIMSILKFSYLHLSPSLKSCFSFCALFPKDFKIRKDELINLWIAHGYIEQSDHEVKSIEELAEDNFQNLVQMGFFQDVYKDYMGRMIFKIHDLMHEMAQHLVGKEILVAEPIIGNLDKKVRHLNASNLRACNLNEYFVTGAKIRTYMSYGSDSPFYFPNKDKLLQNFRTLRALALPDSVIKSLSNIIGELLHLRYLDLSNNQLKILPESLTKLVNLQFLNLYGCSNLEELPKDFSKLVNLRTLYLDNTENLKYMPLGMEKLTCLSKLDKFVLGKTKSHVKQDDVGGLKCLRGLGNRTGSLKIRINSNYKHAKENNGPGGYLSNWQHLTSISIIWPHSTEIESGRVVSEADVLEDLQPPPDNLKKLQVDGYSELSLPRWAREDKLKNSLPHLRMIDLHKCHGLNELPRLGNLRWLKTLRVYDMKNLEYMENRSSDTSRYGAETAGAATTSSSPTARETESTLFFPSLEVLELRDLPNLKGWWRETSMSGSEIEDDEIGSNDSSMPTTGGHQLPSFTCLSRLTVAHCDKLMSMPLCPTVEVLELSVFNERLQIMKENVEGGYNSGNSSYKMRSLTIDNVRYLKTLPMGAFQCVATMWIQADLGNVENLSEVEEVFRNCSSSLRSLHVYWCVNLRSVTGVFNYLTALESLGLSNLPALAFDESDEKGDQEKDKSSSKSMPWRCLGNCLRSLELQGLKKVADLPKGMHYLTALESLQIISLPLKALPEWIECLSSLQRLKIEKCKHLESLPEALRNLTSLKRLDISDCNQIFEEKCKKPDGEDWPKIQHIPRIDCRPSRSEWSSFYSL